MTGGLGKHGFVDYNASERDMPDLLLRTLALGRRQLQSTSIVVALELD